MSEIDEVEVITSGGVPFYYHSNTGREQDDTYLLQASFITALTQFAQELNNGEVKLISLEKKHFLLTKGSKFTLIFTSYHDSGPEMLIEYEPQIQEAKEFLDKDLLQANVDLNDPQEELIDEKISSFNNYLREKELVVKQETFDSRSFRQNVNSLVFKSVGYEPGKCNIGRAERFKRLTFGLLFFTISLGLFAIIIGLGLPEWSVFLLAIPNFFGFLGLLQYFYRFCTTNALSQKYDMN